MLIRSLFWACPSVYERKALAGDCYWNSERFVCKSIPEGHNRSVQKLVFRTTRYFPLVHVPQNGQFWDEPTSLTHDWIRRNYIHFNKPAVALVSELQGRCNATFDWHFRLSLFALCFKCSKSKPTCMYRFNCSILDVETIRRSCC